MPFNVIASLPPQPTFVPGDTGYNERWNGWIGNANTAMDNYRADYEAAMRAQGVTVTWDTPAGAAPGSPLGIPPTYTATLSRDGVTTTALVSLGRAQQVPPEELAQFDMTYNLKWNGQFNSPNGTPPSQWYQNVNAAAPITPGPATTVPVPTVTVQPAQTPHNPDPGTIVTNPTVHTPAVTPQGVQPVQTATLPKYNFWQWNYFHEQETGRTGPAPEEVGVSDPLREITKDEWWAKVKDWYASQATPSVEPPQTVGSGGTTTTSGGGGGSYVPPSGGSGGAGGVVQTQAKDNTLLYVIGGVLVVLLLMKRS